MRIRSVVRKISAALVRPALSLIRSDKGVVVVTLHNVSHSQTGWFEEVVRVVANNYDIASADDLSSEREESFDNIKVLFTFDDGFLSSRKLAEEVLSKYGIKAIYFITEGFVGLNKDEAVEFAQKNFYPDSRMGQLSREDYRSMSWDDVKWLLDHQHSVGAHTKTHPKMNAVDETTFLDEVIASVERVENILGCQINHFAFPFGTPDVIKLHMIQTASDRFDFIFSNVRGGIADSPGDHFLFRQNLVPGDPIWIVQAMIEGKLDWKSRKLQKQAHSIFSQI